MTEHSSHSAATPADDAAEWSKDHLVRWLRLHCSVAVLGPDPKQAPVLKSARMFRDAAEWSEDHSGARSNFANKRA